MFLIPAGDGGLTGRLGQWGMIRAGQRERVEYKEYPSKKPGGQPRRESMLKNNARVETVASSPAFKDAWRGGRRCLIPALRLQEPNWQTGKCVWWQLRRADELPWMVGGIWSEWTDPESGELVNNYAMLTFNVDDHPLLNRLHRPEKDRVTGEVLPPEKQDKRGSAHIEPAHWTTWLQGSIDEAKALLVAPPAEFYDKSDAQRMDEMLTGISSQSVSQRGLIAGNT
ncbi:SOS response-associated peptidase family protein [Mitsuaria sp. PDC51]|uniref:SOS response-associated peptidase family protein n=1 Tax=Mitsuaria sp. PDC51 TaxID=1881035 RepID=UPI0015872A2B|nr:SOS response-associated peptidase family protein [Mitsuaria sp. PDC51]